MKIGIGIIGLGYMGNIFSRIVRDLKDEECNLIAVSDINEKVLKEITALVKCEGYKDYKDLINDERINLVYIATPPATHLEIIKECVSNDKNILCEKPLVAKPKELEIIESLLNSSKVQFQIGLSQRFNILYKYIKEIIETKSLGKIEFIRLNARFTVDEKRVDKGKWLYDLKQGGGTILESSIHYWDMAMWLTNSRVTSVYGKALFREYDNGEYDYISTAIGELENGAIVNVDNIFSMPKNFFGDRRVEVIGEKGTIYVNQLNGPIFICSDENVNTNFVNSGSEVPTFPDMFNGGNEIGSYRRELISFIENIRKGIKPSPGFKEAEMATKVTHAVLKSVKLDKKVKVIL